MSKSASSFLDRHYFLLRRLHSLSGVAPIGLFLFPHLTTNSSIVWGRFLGHGDGHDGAAAGVATFQHEVNFIHDLPALKIIEFTALFFPILFHSVLGVWFATSGKSNTMRYAYQDNWRYSLQRATGYVGIVFLFMHIMSLRFGLEFGGLMPTFDPDYASSSTAEHFQKTGGFLLAAFYAIGVLSLVFHFANGLWTAAITWGLTVSVSAQRRWGYVCAAIGVALAGAGLTAILGFATLDQDLARSVEQTILGEEVAADANADLAASLP
ncbi:MAG: hypothetical protein AAF432_07225 [Planctomycetota bacterium]